MTKTVRSGLGRAASGLLSMLYRGLRRAPVVRKQVDRRVAEVIDSIAPALKPYAGEYPSRRALPADGLARESLLREVEEMSGREQQRWRNGFVSGAVYHGDDEHIEFLNRVYAVCSQLNPLHADLWPSGVKYEAEIIAMTGRMLSAPGDEIFGSVSSGGTESILLAMKAYRDHARRVRGIRSPEIVAPVTAHAAFDKAAEYFRMKLVKIPVGADFRADVAAAREAIGRRTAVVVGSAPSFPHGVIDSIAELSELARASGAGFHTDACLGGFVLPWAERLGHDVPSYDFRLPGVTSISVDTHKYGYAPKGSSVILYRDRALRHAQYFTATDWPGGLYASPTLAGSRPGGLIAACWAALLSVGEAGYLHATERILDAAARIRHGIESIPELRVLGDPLWVIAFAAEGLDIYRVLDFMMRRGWNLNGLHRPPCVHMCVTLRHTQDGVADRFVEDLRLAVAHVVAHPDEPGGLAPVYGMAARLPVREVVDDVLRQYMDRLYEA